MDFNDAFKWKAIPQTNIGETLYGSTEIGLRESIAAIGGNSEAYVYVECNWKKCPNCSGETESFASDVIVGGEDICSDCFKNQEQKST